MGDIGTEVADFQAGFWSQELFMDTEMSFFKALGGGEFTQHSFFSFLGAIAPFSNSRTKQHLAAANEVQGNLSGEGFITGGVYVVRQDGKAAYTFHEEELGDHAPIEDVIEAVKAAVKGESVGGSSGSATGRRNKIP